MKKLFALCLIAFTALTLQAQTPDLAGNWQGTLTLPNGKSLRTIFGIAKDDNLYKSTFYSIDQGQSLKASTTKLTGSDVTIDFSAMGIAYQGKLSADNNTITGTFTQGATPLPLLLVRATKETAWEIPAPPPPRKLMAPDANPSFDVATIKPNNSGANSMQGITVNGRNFATRATSLDDLIAFAYNIQIKQVVSAPDWADNDRYDIAAVPDAEGDPNVEQLRVMMRKLLTERFKLTFHHEKRELPAFVLTVGKNGSKVTPTQVTGSLPGFGMGPGKGGLTMHLINATMQDFTSFLQMTVLDRPVVDQTGLTGKFDMSVLFSPDDSLFNGHPPKMPAQAEGVESAPSFFDALQQTAGLKLEAKKAPVDVLVIDHVEKPTAN
jgi:uncharacterized protein (TIGR03435 family)